MNLSVRDLCYISVFTVFIIIASTITIPLMYGIPISLQTLAVSLCGMVLEPKKGALSAILYIMVGALGIPVFAGLRGGLAVLVGPLMRRGLMRTCVRLLQNLVFLLLPFIRCKSSKNYA